jgi:uncharacterized protein (TIGR00251 family)
MTCYHWQGENLILLVHIQPRASQTGIVGIHQNRLKIKTTAAPVDGQANAKIYQLLAKLFGVAKSRIVLLNGQTSRDKSFLIPSPSKLPEFISPPPSSSGDYRARCPMSVR